MRDSKFNTHTRQQQNVSYSILTLLDVEWPAWVMTSRDKRGLQAAERPFFRSATGKTRRQRIRNDDIMNTGKLYAVIYHHPNKLHRDTRNKQKKETRSQEESSAQYTPIRCMCPYSQKPINPNIMTSTTLNYCVTSQHYIKWQIDPLLGNDRETNKSHC
jgi:hypothetical protein